VNTNSPVPALGLAYLVGALQQAGFRTNAIDATGLAPDQCVPFDDLPFLVNGLSAEQIAERISDESVLVGVSCMFSREWPYQRRVIQSIRRRFPYVPILVGGEHVTADPESVLRSCPEVSACALGEGEETIVDAARAVSAGRELTDVAGLVLPVRGEVIRTAPRRRIRSIDQIAWPEWEGMPVENYLGRGFAMEEYGRRSIPMLASRGCPYRCTFCSSPQMWGTTWLARDPADVIREIERYVERYRIEHVEFFDLTTVVDRRWILRFTQGLIEKDLGITWTMPSGTRSEALDAEVLAQLRRSGCRGITYAPESGSPATLERIKKKVRPERMLESIRAAVAEGMYVKVHLIVGLPGQTRYEIWESFVFLLRLVRAGVHDVLVYPFNAYPGSEIHARFVASGRIDPRSPDYDRFLLGADYGDLGNLRSWSEHLSAAGIRYTAATCMLVFFVGQFLLRPWRALAALTRIARGRPVTWLQRALSAQIRIRLLGSFVPSHR
jgi:radical SAM superfamily enzyme YgiQ (UPF0313 family)